MILLRLLHTLVAMCLVTVDVIVAGSIGVLVGWLPPKGDWARAVARGWARVALWAALVRLKVEGAERAPSDTPVVYMANHESWIDIPALLVAIPGQVRFLAKKNLFSVPFLGWAMSAMGFIPVDRKNRRTAVKSFEEAAARIKAGRSVLVFPEETRTRDGHLLSFQRGGFLIAMKADLPIVPVGLDGPRRLLPKFSYLLRPGTVTVRFGAPVPTAGRSVTTKGELIEEVRAAVNQLRGGGEIKPQRGSAPVDTVEAAS